MARWQNGDAADCKSVNAGSIPARASTLFYTSMTEFVVLVTPQDEVVGLMEKLQAHVEGLLHRAFSVFTFNSKGELLIQQRAAHKYHSPTLWANTCCSHPRDGEGYEQGAHRRLQEEMGFDCPLEFKFDFLYKADVGGGLTEHELDYIFFGVYDGEIVPNPDEVMAYQWVNVPELKTDIHAHPEKYTAWFKMILDQYPDLLDQAANAHL